MSDPPYNEWTWKEQPLRVGGPNFLVLPNGNIIGTSRGYDKGKKSSMYLAKLTTEGDVTPIIKLPSGGDNSYAGMLIHKDKLLVSYYSSHEGRAAIYLATISLSAFNEQLIKPKILSKK